MAAAEEFALDALAGAASGQPEAAPRRRLAWPFAHPLAHYEKIYDASPRTIKGWLAIGRAATPPDLPPYDAPEQMANWYARHKKNRVPDHLVQLAAQAARDAAPPTSPPPALSLSSSTLHAEPSAGMTACGIVSTPQPQSGAPATNRPPASAPAIAQGFQAALDRLRSAEATAGQRYTDFLLANKEAEAEAAGRIWQKLRNDLRLYEKEATEVLQATGQLWVAVDVTAVIYELHSPLRDGVESLYDRIEAQLDTLPRAERKVLYRAEARRLFAALIANKFTAPPAQTIAAA